MPAIGEVLARPVFRVGERVFTWRDVTASAHARGEWDAIAERGYRESQSRSPATCASATDGRRAKAASTPNNDTLTH